MRKLISTADETTRQVIENGRIVRTKETFFKNKLVNVDTEYAYVYGAMINNIGIGGGLATLLVLGINSEINEGICYLPNSRRVEFAQKLGITVQSFNDKLTKLKKGGYIYLSGGTAKINPRYIWRGTDEYKKLKIKEWKGLFNVPEEITRGIFDNSLVENYD